MPWFEHGLSLKHTHEFHSPSHTLVLPRRQNLTPSWCSELIMLANDSIKRGLTWWNPDGFIRRGREIRSNRFFHHDVVQPRAERQGVQEAGSCCFDLVCSELQTQIRLFTEYPVSGNSLYHYKKKMTNRHQSNHVHP